MKLVSLMIRRRVGAFYPQQTEMGKLDALLCVSAKTTEEVSMRKNKRKCRDVQEEKEPM